MKNIDIKSLLIGALFTSTVLLGVAAVPKDTGTGAGQHLKDQWDNKQEWEVAFTLQKKQIKVGWEPFGVDRDGDWIIRRRIK